MNSYTPDFAHLVTGSAVGPERVEFVEQIHGASLADCVEDEAQLRCGLPSTW